MLGNQRPVHPSWFSIGLKNTSLVEDVELLLPVKFRQILFSCLRKKFENVSANQRLGGGGVILFFQNINFEEDFEFLLPINFRQIPYSSFREEVKMS